MGNKRKKRTLSLKPIFVVLIKRNESIILWFGSCIYSGISFQKKKYVKMFLVKTIK